MYIIYCIYIYICISIYESDGNDAEHLKEEGESDPSLGQKADSGKDTVSEFRADCASPVNEMLSQHVVIVKQAAPAADALMSL